MKSIVNFSIYKLCSFKALQLNTNNILPETILLNNILYINMYSVLLNINPLYYYSTLSSISALH